MKPLTLAQETPVVSKTKELCHTILTQPGFQQIKESILEFMRHDEAREMYETLCTLQDTLGEKQEQGEPITEAEHAHFAEVEEAFLAMPVAQGFIQAQRQMHKIEKTISDYVHKTFELGRVPEDDDFSRGGCGPSCGCGG